MMHKFAARLLRMRRHFYVWLRLRVFMHSSISNKQYKQLVEVYDRDRVAAREMLAGMVFLESLAKIPDEERPAAAIRMGTSLITGQSHFELTATGDQAMAGTMMNIIRCLMATPDEGVMGLGFGAAIRTMQLMMLARAVSIAAALLAGHEEATPQAFLAYVSESMRDEEEFKKVRDSLQRVANMDAGKKKEGGTISKEQADELEKLFGLTSERRT